MENIPFWIKNDARSWYDGKINNSQFGKGLEYLISTGIVKTGLNAVLNNSFEHIPSWVKHIAGWWSQDMLSDNEYVKSIQYLLQNKIITTVN
jgi:hypothetical protein